MTATLVNPLLAQKITKHDELRAKMLGVQTAAADAKRDLTDEELRSLADDGRVLGVLAADIQRMGEEELRASAVGNLAAKLAVAPDPKTTEPGTAGVNATQTRAAAGTGEPLAPAGDAQNRSRTTTQDRDPGHYRSVKEGGERSFFADLVRAAEDRHGVEGGEAARRLLEHHRALGTDNGTAGIIPPKWLTSEYEAIPRQERAVANTVRHLDLGNDPRPIVLPLQTAGTDDVVGDTDEHGPVPGDDAFDTNTETLTPGVVSGKQRFSRVSLDSSDPAIDQLIFTDLLSVYDFKIEGKVCAALIAKAGTPVVALASEAEFADQEGGAADAVVDTATEVWAARFAQADNIAMTIRRFGKFRKLKDTAGRPLYPILAPQNANGVVRPQTGMEIEGLTGVGSAGMGSGLTGTDSIVVYRGFDTILAESAVMRFRYEEVAGPEHIDVGIWAYAGVLVRQQGRSTKRFTVAGPSGS